MMCPMARKSCPISAGARMSATSIAIDWRLTRAAWVLRDRNGRAVDIAFYAALFEIGFDETVDLFARVAKVLGTASFVAGTGPELLH